MSSVANKKYVRTRKEKSAEAKQRVVSRLIDKGLSREEANNTTERVVMRLRRNMIGSMG